MVVKFKFIEILKLKKYLITSFRISVVIYFLSSCSLSGSIKSVGSQKDEVPASPITSPVTGSDELRLTEPTDYIKPSNESAYPITGSCKTSGTLTIEVNNTVVKSDVSCVNETFTTTLDLASITSGEVTIKVISNENTSTVSTVAIIKDIVAPSLIGAITDGTYFNSTSTTPTLTWIAAADTHSGISHYEVAIGTTAGGTNTLNWTSTNSTTASHSQSGLTLAEGTTYFASLRAVDNAGNVSTTIQSDGWIVDATAPTLATSFIDGEINFSSTSSKMLNWVASTDAASGLSGYEVALGTTAGATDVMNWTSVGNVITETIDSLTLFGNRRYYASLRSVDAAGNRTASVMGDGWWNLRSTKKAVDVTSPPARWFSDYNNFGFAIDLSEDGSTLVVGAPGDSLDSSGGNYLYEAGSVFVYIMSGGQWVLQQKITPTGVNARVAGDLFGESVAISGDTIAVGNAMHDYDDSGGGSLNDSGAVFVYTRTGSVWSQQQKVVATGTNSRLANQSFGIKVSLSGESLAVSTYNSYDALGENLVAGAGSVFVYTRNSGVWSLQQRVVATGTNARVSGDEFGSSIKIENDTLAVGALGQDYNASGATLVSGAGAAFIFTRNAGVWSQQGRLVATGTNARIASDQFGFSIALSGDTVVVGAPYHDYNLTGAGLLNNSGAAYVYTRTAGVWSQQAKLISSGTNGRVAWDITGYDLAIDQDTIILGSSNYYDLTGQNPETAPGSAFIFTRSAGVWSQLQKVIATGVNARESGSYFAIQGVAIKGDIANFGSYGHDYDASGAIFNDQAGAVFSFERSAGTWSQQQIVNDTSLPQSRLDLVENWFGTSVDISEDGTKLVVGASSDTSDENGSNFVYNAGAVYIFTKTSGNWVFQQKLVAVGVNARSYGDSFGYSVSISGNTLVVGANSQDYNASGAGLLSSAGAAFVYTESAGVWSFQQKLVATGTNARMANDYFGTSVSIDGDSIVIGASDQDYDGSGNTFVSAAGAAYVFTRSVGVWSQQAKLVATGTNARLGSDLFGRSVAISSDTVVVGAYQQDYDESGNTMVSSAGAAYVFTRSAGVWSQQAKLIASGVNARITNDYFGHRVAISSDTIVIGAYQQDYDSLGEALATNAGAAYVFIRSAGVWSQQAKLVASGTNARLSEDYFAYNLDIRGNTIVIGSYANDYDMNGNNLISFAGSAFVFSRINNSWIQQVKLTASGVNSRTADSYFGIAVAISENESNDGYTIAVGAEGDSFDSSGANPVTSAGSVYIFD